MRANVIARLVVAAVAAGVLAGGGGAPAGAACDAAGCLESLVAKGRVVVRDRTPDAADMLLWKLRKGAATALADFGSPLDNTSFDLCLGDGTGATLFQTTIPPGGVCGARPCWKASGNKFRYRNRTPGSGELDLLILQAGAEGKTRITVRGKGPLLGPPAPPFALPVTIRLAASTGGCWADRVGTFVLRNDASGFKAKSGIVTVP